MGNIEGRLRLCSRSIVFEPSDVSRAKKVRTNLDASEASTTWQTETETETSSNNRVEKVALNKPPIYLFGKGNTNGNKGESGPNSNDEDDKYLLGGKGANLAVMSRIGISVPPGFTISKELYDAFSHQWN